MHAYGTLRAVQRSTKNVCHAVDEISHLCGAHDTACGKPVVRHLGVWVPGAAGNCQRCTAVLAERATEESCA